MNDAESRLRHRSEELKKQNHITTALKYTVLIVLLAMFVVFALQQGPDSAHQQDRDPAHQQDRDSAHQLFVHELFVSAVAAVAVSLILSVMHDFITKREEKLNAELERDMLINGISRELLLRGLNSMSEPDLGSLIATLARQEPRFVPELIKATNGGGHFTELILKQYFDPIWAGSHHVQTEWANELLPAANPGRYRWKGTRLFDNARGQKSFLVAVTDDIKVALRLEGSAIFDDVLVAGKPVGESTEVSPPQITLRLSGWNPTLRQPKTVVLHPTQLSDEELAQRLKSHGRDSLDRMRAYECTFPGVDEIRAEQFEYAFEIELALHEPIFYLRTERLSWIKRIKIDYSQIRHLLGSKVWVANFIGGQIGEINHNEARATVSIKIDEVLLPGNGVALVWETNPPGSESLHRH